jgi:aspartyl-tRNA(Asn)/glutamyl-tRNA(Gln) amidotransferase subunit A
MELCDLGALELTELLKRREVSSREITESVFSRIDEREEEIHAYITLNRKGALEQADRADAKIRSGEEAPPLNGIPIAILANYIPPYDATAVKRALGQGAVLIGKTNMDEFAMGSSTENSAFGATRNPLDLTLVPGGSSGGSAAAVAAGETVLALGSDTGGSIRQPAAFCGVVGMKPTYGRVSRYGLVSYASSLDQVGPLGRNVEDCSLLLNSICGYDELDTTSAKVPRPDFMESLHRDVKGVRIGLPKEYFVEGLDGAVKDQIVNSLNLLMASGAHIVDISLPHTRFAISTYYLIATAEACSNLARYDGVKYGLRVDGDFAGAIEMYEKVRSSGFGKEVKRRIMLGTYVLSAGYYDAYYLKAQRSRTLIREDFSKAFEKVDCIVTPVSPSLPFKIGDKIDEPLQMYLVDIYTVSLNLAGLPGISVNCGTVGGLPVGLQFIGKPFDEETLIRIAHAHQQLSGKS